MTNKHEEESNNHRGSAPYLQLLEMEREEAEPGLNPAPKGLL